MFGAMTPSLRGVLNDIRQGKLPNRLSAPQQLSDNGSDF
ncbi:Unknown protein sequence [Pseudomonas coronafaciens pv. oryzae]|nr:Unknown protein sequence [Pseudomonas coronafaciens pv. oryzae]